MNRRHVMGAVALAIAAFTAPAQAQDYKGKTIRIVVPAPPGSAPDVIARVVTDNMRAQLGATVVIENKPGAGGIIAVNQVKGAAPDGMTLLFTQGAVVAISPHTYKEAKFDFERDFEAISAIADTPMLLAANPAKGPATLPAALEAVKAKPESVSLGSPVRTSIPHLAAEMMDQTMGTRFQQVPMGTTSQGIQAVVNGDIHLYIDGVAPIMPMVKAGRLKALAVTAPRELPGLEGIPLAKDVVPNLVVSGWFALFAPKGTPAPLIAQLNSAASTAVQNADVIAKMRNMGTYPLGGSVAQAQAFVKKEKTMWAEVIRKSGIQPE